MIKLPATVATDLRQLTVDLSINCLQNSRKVVAIIRLLQTCKTVSKAVHSKHSRATILFTCLLQIHLLNRHRRYRVASDCRMALPLGDHESSHATTGSPGEFTYVQDLVDPSLSGSARAAFPLVVGVRCIGSE